MMGRATCQSSRFGGHPSPLVVSWLPSVESVPPNCRTRENKGLCYRCCLPLGDNSHSLSRCPFMFHGKLSVWLWCGQRTDPVPVSFPWPAASSRWEDLCGWVQSSSICQQMVRVDYIGEKGSLTSSGPELPARRGFLWTDQHSLAFETWRTGGSIMQRKPSVHKQWSPAEHCAQDKWIPVL